MTIHELLEEFEALTYEEAGINFENMEDGCELFWVRQRGVWKDRIVIKNGKEIVKKDDVFCYYDYQPFRVLLSKKHHRSTAGWEPCVIAAPNGEFPWLVPWQCDWIYAYRSELFRRKNNEKRM